MKNSDSSAMSESLYSYVVAYILLITVCKGRDYFRYWQISDGKNDNYLLFFIFCQPFPVAIP